MTFALFFRSTLYLKLLHIKIFIPSIITPFYIDPKKSWSNKYVYIVCCMRVLTMTFDHDFLGQKSHGPSFRRGLS